MLTTTEEKGQTFLAVHHDTIPQLFIQNSSGAKLFLSQRPKLPNGNSSSSKTHHHFRWLHSVENNQSTHFTMCGYSDKFPNLNHLCIEENVVVTCDEEAEQWSTPIDVLNYNDQFIRVPFLGDVKVSVAISAHTTFLVIASVSSIEISASDIRVRLFMRSSEEAGRVSTPTARFLIFMSQISERKPRREFRSHAATDAESSLDCDRRWLCEIAARAHVARGKQMERVDRQCFAKRCCRHVDLGSGEWMRIR